MAPIKAIIPVHIGGYSCDMDPIISIAKRYNLKTIEDAAHALPSSYNKRRIGTISDLTVFSFYATKTITTGEGGMVVTDDPEYCRRIKIMRLHGIDRDIWDRYQARRPSWYYEIVDAGFKYNMSDIAASIGMHQMKKVNIFLKKRERIASIYNKEFGNIGEIRLPTYKDTRNHSWHLYMISLNSKRFSRDEFIKKLYEKGVGASVHFIPLHIHPYYRKRYNYTRQDYPVAYECYKKEISLPIYTKMNDEDVHRVVKAVRGLLS